MDLNILWFLLVGVALAGYAILDGFDLGVGALHLFHKTDQARRISLNAIGPIWDGNEVWLVVGGGALFAAFPEAYATAFSAFYNALMLLLAALIMRAVSIEFRSKEPGKTWRSFWDTLFSVSSMLVAVLIGVALGNVMVGLELDARHEFTGTFLGLLNPVSIMTGLLTLALFMMHGAIYLVMKTEDAIQERVKRWVQKTMILFLVVYALTTMAVLIYVPRMVEPYKENPVLFVVPALTLLTIANIPRLISKKRGFWAFIFSSLTVFFLMALFSVGLFPDLIPAKDPANSLNLYNAASSQKTLGIMAIIAAIGMPFVIGYHIFIYRVFRGKVKIDEMSY